MEPINQSAPQDENPRYKISKKSVSDYLAWEVSTILNNNKNTKDKKSFKVVILLNKELTKLQANTKLGDLFEINPTKYYRFTE
jgi:hypothetical protein